MPYPARRNPALRDKLGPTCLQSGFAGTDSKDELNTNEQGALAVKRADCMLGAMARVRPEGAGKSFFPSVRHFVRLHLDTVHSFGLPSTDIDIPERVPWKASKMRRLKHMIHKERLIK